MRNLNKTLLIVTLMASFVLSSCEDSLENTPEKFDVSSSELSELDADFGLESVEFIILEGNQIFKKSELNHTNLKFIKASLEAAEDFVYNTEKKEVFIFSKRADINPNEDDKHVIIAKTFENPFIKESKELPQEKSKKRGRWQSTVRFHEHAEFRGRQLAVVSGPTTVNNVARFKGRRIGIANVGLNGRAFNDIASGYFIRIAANFPIVLEGDLFEHDRYRGARHQLSGSALRPLPGGSYTISFIRRNLKDIGFNDKMTSFLFRVSSVDI